MHGVFAEAVSSGVHHMPNPGFILRHLGVIELARPIRPRCLWQRDQRINDLPRAGVQHSGHAAGIGQGPGFYRCPNQLARVQPGQLRSSQGAP